MSRWNISEREEAPVRSIFEESDVADDDDMEEDVGDNIEEVDVGEEAVFMPVEAVFDMVQANDGEATARAQDENEGTIEEQAEEQIDYDFLDYPCAVLGDEGDLVDLPYVRYSPPIVPEPGVSAEPSVAAEPGDATEAEAVAADGSGTRGGRGRRWGPGRGRGGSSENVWQLGDRLVQVYPRDEDISAAVMEAARGRGGRGRSRGRGRGLSRGGGRGRGVAMADGRPSDVIPNENSDADDVISEAASYLFGDDPEAVKFDWQPIGSFRGQPEQFLPGVTGPTQPFDNAYDSFRAIWTDDFLEQIVTETNRYAEQNPSSRGRHVGTNLHEILMLFAFYMLLGIVRYPTIDACFSKSYLFSNKSFSVFFSRSRYFFLNSRLHFTDNLTADRTFRLYQIYPVIEHLNRRFQALYTPKQNITIDESLTLWKGMLNFKQYMPLKAARFGIKSFELCCSMTSYLWSFFVYTGSEESTIGGERSSVGCPKVIATVLSLIRPLLNKGYRLWMDNWFNSPILARFLKRNQTDCVGTLRLNRKHVPKHIGKIPLKVGQYMARTSQDMCIMSWQDKNRVTTLSTFHNDEIEMGPSKGRNDIFKPKVVQDYNKFMGGVDKKDQMLEPYHVERRRCQKWYLKLFKRLLNVSILNSRILVEESTGRRVDHLKFRISLVDEIYKRHFKQCPTRRNEPSTASFADLDDRYDVGKGHFPVQLSATDMNGADTTDGPGNEPRPEKRKRRTSDEPQTPRARSIRKRCVWCLEKGRSDNKTTIKCEVCNVPLCCTPCFKWYHTRTTDRNRAPNTR